MSKALNIFIQGVTLDNANVNPLLYRVRFWQKKHHIVWIATKQFLKKNNIHSDSIPVPQLAQINALWSLVIVGFARNVISFPRIMINFKNDDVFYSISSLIDLCLVPFLLKVCGKKFVWAVVFDNWVDRRKNYGSRNFLAYIFFRISLFMLKKADYIYYMSPELKNKLINSEIHASKLVQSKNGLEIELIAKTFQERRSNIKRKHFSFKFDAIYIGRIHEEKGILDLLQMVDIVVKSYPHFKLAVVGDGNVAFIRTLKTKIKNKGLSNNIIFEGQKFRSDKYELLLHSKVFLFLSDHESFGLALIEAVTSGLPAIAYDLDVFKKIYKYGEVNLLRKKNIDKVAKRLIAILNSEEYLNQTGYKLLQNYQSWENIAKNEVAYFFKPLDQF